MIFAASVPGASFVVAPITVFRAVRAPFAVSAAPTFLANVVSAADVPTVVEVSPFLLLVVA